MSNSLDPDQELHFVTHNLDRLTVSPDLDPNCLQKLSADETSRPTVNSVAIFMEAPALSKQFFIFLLGAFIEQVSLDMMDLKKQTFELEFSICAFLGLTQRL